MCEYNEYKSEGWCWTVEGEAADRVGVGCHVSRDLICHRLPLNTIYVSHILVLSFIVCWRGGIIGFLCQVLLVFEIRVSPASQVYNSCWTQPSKELNCMWLINGFSICPASLAYNSEQLFSRQEYASTVHYEYRF